VTATLRERLADYLALRRALGYRMARPEKLMGQFLDHFERAGEARITVAAALDWARLPTDSGSSWWAYRLSTVRGFATYLHTRDPEHEVPAAELLPQRPHRASPYLYSDTEIAALIAATGSLGSPLRRATFATLIGLLAVTGIRVGEAIALDRGHIDYDAGRLVVRHGKFGKTRELALHPTTVDALRSYQRLRDRTAPQTGTAALLVSTAGTQLLYCSVHHAFHRLVGLAVHFRAVPIADRATDKIWPGSSSKPTVQRTWQPVGRSAVSALAPTLQAFFTNRLIRQRQHHRRLPRPGSSRACPAGRFPAPVSRAAWCQT